jgi:hypothetical protein
MILEAITEYKRLIEGKEYLTDEFQISDFPEEIDLVNFKYGLQDIKIIRQSKQATLIEFRKEDDLMGQRVNEQLWVRNHWKIKVVEEL